MTSSILVFGLLAGLDNLQVCSSIGLAPIPRSRLHRMAAMFCFCETAAPLAGLLMAKAMLSAAGAWAHVAGPAVMIACGIAIFHAALRQSDESVSETGAFALPLALCVDNVFAGAGISPMAGPVWMGALYIGITSSLMSCVGVYGAQWIRRLLTCLPRVRVEMVGATYLVLVAIHMLTERSV